MGMATFGISSYNKGMKKFTTQVEGVLFTMVFIATYLFSIAPTNAFAAETLPTGAFIVQPAKIELAILPGEEETRVLTLSNGTAFPLLVSVSYEDVATNIQTTPNDEPIRLLGKNGGAYPLKELFSTTKQSFNILSGKEVQLPITVHIPSDTEAGGRYGSVVLTLKPILSVGTKQDMNIAVESRLATLFYVRVRGEAKEKGHLVAFGLFNNAKTTPVPSGDTPLKFQVAYENTGTVHVNPYGRLTLTPLIGTAKTYIIDPLAVLPSETRMREVDVRDVLPIGYYRAHLELNRGYKDIVDESEVGFFVIPGAMGMTVIILGIIFLTWLIRRSLALSKHFVA